MKILFTSLLFFLLLSSQNLFSQDTSLFRYLPLNIGNVWVYAGYNYNVLRHCDDYEKYTVRGTSLNNGNIFYIIQRELSEFSGNSTNCGSFFVGSRLFTTGLIRIDSVTYNISGDNSTCIIDSLASQPLNSNNVCQSHFNLVHCDTGRTNLYGMNRKTKSFGGGSFESFESMTYAMDIGLIRYSFFQPGPNPTSMNLKGCVINGIVYGDTGFMVGINKISSEIPKHFFLSQNYPNPFNPTTTIKFAIPPLRGARGMTTLVIYDALGQEVAILVNQQLTPGTYEVQWDASNYPSGVYFYKLESGDYSETKKMVLIK